MAEKQEIFTLLGGRVKMYRSMYNPTSDAVWLAALPNKAPTNVLDVGIGTGGVSLCLLAHYPNAKVTGIDTSLEMLETCQRNADLNNQKIDLVNQDIFKWSPPKTFDLVISNPPYFQGTPTKQNPGIHHNSDLNLWIRRCIARVRPMGYFCTIVDAGCLGNVLGEVSKHCGDITIIPLFGAKKTAERVLIRCRNASKGNSVMHIGYPMNYEPVLRNGLTIQEILSSI